MPIYVKADSSANIINGVQTVLNNGKLPAYRSDMRDVQNYASGDSLVHFQALENRFLIAPSGWNGA